MQNRTIQLAIVAVLVLCSTAVARDTQREARLKEMRQCVEMLVPVGKDAQLSQVREQPVMRYSDPVRNIVDASIWAVGRKGRPRAMVALELYGKNDSKFVNYELTATSRNVEATMEGPNFTWRMDGSEPELQFNVLSGAAAPEATKLIRGRQMAEIATKLSASEESEGQTYQLRVNPSPLLRYQDQDAGILDGSVFALARGNDAELLVLIEAQQAKENAVWRVAFARLGEASFNVSYDHAPIWQGRHHQPTRRNYFNEHVRLPGNSDCFSCD